jgi:hypothetical protein
MMEPKKAYDIAHGTLKKLAAEIAKEQVKRHKFFGRFNLHVELWVHVDYEPFIDHGREADYEIQLDGEVKWNALSNPTYLLDYFESRIVTWPRVAPLASMISMAEKVAGRRGRYKSCAFDFELLLRPTIKILA